MTKRVFDICLAFCGLILCGWLILLAALAVRIATGKSGFFRQERVGLYGRRFMIVKLRTMRDLPGVDTHITTACDSRITTLGRFLRKSKIDELPQLINVLKGEMSIVGPRPDVPQVADRLFLDAPLVLSVRPGITGPASIKYRNEERLLSLQPDPVWFNASVIFPDKVRINLEYVENYCWLSDLKYLWQTITGTGKIATATELLRSYRYEQRVA